MYLYGAGGHAKVIMDILKENSTDLTGIIDDNPHIQEWMEYHVLSYDPKRMFPILISIGNNSIRKNIAEQLYKKNAVFGTVMRRNNDTVLSVFNDFVTSVDVRYDAR